MDEKNDPKRKKLLHNLIKNFSIDDKFQPVTFLKSFVEKFRYPRRHKMFERAQTKIIRELDLLKFIERQRL